MSGITKHVSRLTAAFVLLAPFLPTASAQEPSFLIEPFAADLAGGAWFRINGPIYQDLDGMPSIFSRTAYFDGIPMEFFPRDCFCDDFNFCDCAFDGTIPPGNTPGIVDVSVLIDDNGVMTWHEFPEAFTYVDAPIVEVLEPDNQSIGPDNRQLTLRGAGFPIRRGAEVWIGEQQATAVEVLISNLSKGFGKVPGTALRCTPPPFPGGDWPLSVDVRVVTIGGGETILPNAYTYRQIVPVIQRSSRTSFPAWTISSAGTALRIENLLLVEGIQVFFDDIPVEVRCFGPCPDSLTELSCTIPQYHKPDLMDITVVNPDGGTYTAKDAFTFFRTNPFHLADTNQDNIIDLSELLRVIQFYQMKGHHCDPSTEDGFAPGALGDTSCIPHDSDLITQDWRVDFHEALEIIQLYNFNGYSLCENRYQFCAVNG